MRLILNLACLALILALANSEENSGWSWGGEENKKSSVEENDSTTVAPSTDNKSTDEEQGEVVQPRANSNIEADVEQVIEDILASNRQGRNLEGYDEVYSDPSVQQALQNGDDGQARNIIKDKLCYLGLMQCDENVDSKRPYLSPEDLIYAQPVALKPYGRPIASVPLRGPPRAYGPPRPMPFPPGHPGNHGPVYSANRKGYGPPKPGSYRPFPPPKEYPAGPPVYSVTPPPSYGGSSFQSSQFSQSSNFARPPIGNKYEIAEVDTSPYEFQGGPFQSGLKEKPAFVVNGQGSTSSIASGVDGVQKHVHHHFHHNADANGQKNPTVIVNNPGLSQGYLESSNNLNSISGNLGFNPVSSGYGGNFKPYKDANYGGINNGFKGVNSGLGTAAGANGLYAAGAKPILEPSAPGYGSLAGNGGAATFGSANGFNVGANSYSSNAYGSNSYGAGAGTYGGAGSYGASSSTFYKKELDVRGPAYELQSNGAQYQGNAYQSNGASYQGNAYQNNGNGLDCVCVPFNQCPAPDVLGRKDDLLLPIDPRNLGSNIEALSDEIVVTNGNGTMTIVRLTKDANSTDSEATGETKKIAKRATAEDKQDSSSNDKKVEARVYSYDGVEGIGGLKKKNVIPTVGVSFGLPSGSGPLNHFGPSLHDPYGNGGPIRAGGFDLGLGYVNPFLAIQLTKNEYGEKVIKPIVNFHITPNERLVGKFNGFKQYLHHLHYVHHSHHAVPPPPPIFHGPPPHHYAPHHHSPHYYSRPPPHVYREEPPHPHPPTDDYDYDDDDHVDFDPYGERRSRQDNSNTTNITDPSRNERSRISLPKQAPGAEPGAGVVTFPNSRRKRDTTTNDIIRDKRQADGYYGGLQQLQQCGPRQVCCRRPRQPHTQQGRAQCGVRNSQGINGRIKNPVYVDGDSEFGEYPWQVAILKKDPKESVYVCGGTLIDHQHIITAAHCIKTYTGFDLRVRLGEWDVNHDVEFYPYVERDVISVHVHPEYYAGTLDNDLAVLKLSQPVDWTRTPHISPACLPERHSDFTGARCWTTGWGKDAFGDFGKYQNILKEVDVPVIGDAQCQAQLRQTRLGYSYRLNPGFLCAGGEEGKDACKGDGGGPLVCERGGVWHVAGVVSWGIGCGQPNVPGVYIKVSHYIDWIRQITAQY